MKPSFGPRQKMQSLSHNPVSLMVPVTSIQHPARPNPFECPFQPILCFSGPIVRKIPASPHHLYRVQSIRCQSALFPLSRTVKLRLPLLFSIVFTSTTTLPLSLHCRIQLCFPLEVTQMDLIFDFTFYLRRLEPYLNSHA
jgi:hypothetical protein